MFVFVVFIQPKRIKFVAQMNGLVTLCERYVPLKRYHQSIINKTGPINTSIYSLGRCTKSTDAWFSSLPPEEFFRVAEEFFHAVEKFFHAVEEFFRVVEEFFRVVEEFFRVAEEFFRVVEEFFRVVEEFFRVAEEFFTDVREFSQRCEPLDSVLIRVFRG